jgi:peptidoglycan/xylan/chitin deacetylase (PgdA/CDA1 family)
MRSYIHPSFVPSGSLRSCLCAFLILAAAAFCAEALNYTCTNCTSPACVCATVQPPGGLNVTNVPQMVLLTFDDEISTATYAVIESVVTNHVNPNGTPIQATFYILSQWNDYRLAQQLYAQGHELGIHTMTHTTTTNTDLATWRREIYGCRKALSDLAQIPFGEIVGFRAPGLDYNHASFQALYEAGLLYDASVGEGLGGLSPNNSSYIWPYTLDNGLGQIAYKPPPTNSFPGLFEVPLWKMLNGSGAEVTTMDFPAGTSNEILNILKLNLENRYMGGNRAPMGLFMHATTGYAGSLGEAGQAWRIDLLNEFIRWALSNPDFESNVWFVSTRAAVEYMKNPVPLTAITSFPYFVTTEKTIPPVSMVVTCAWTSATFRTCAECPPVYPDPTRVFGKAAVATGGVIETTIYEPHATEYGAWLLISNNTDRTIVEWEAEFRVFKGQIQFFNPGLYTTTVVGSGTKVVAHPYPSSRPLYPGEVETNSFWVTNNQGNVSILDKKVTFYELLPTEPTINNIAVVGTNVAPQWDNVAANYVLMFTTNRDFSNWQEVEVHGRTSVVTVLPPQTDYGYFKLKTAY